MSSEESDENEDYQFIIHTLPWRGKDLTKLLYALDKKTSKNCSVRSNYVTDKRKEGLQSDRLKPAGYPKYTFQQ